jgi:hypothetical protein
MLRTYGLESRRQQGNFFLIRKAWTGTGPTHFLNEWLLGTFFTEVKRPGHEAEHCRPNSVMSKNEWLYTSTYKVCFHDAYKDAVTCSAVLFVGFMIRHSAPAADL